MTDSADLLARVVRELDAGLRLLADLGVRKLDAGRPADLVARPAERPAAEAETGERWSKEYRFGDGRRAKLEQAAMAHAAAAGAAAGKEPSMNRQSVLFGSRAQDQDDSDAAAAPEPPDPHKAQQALDDLVGEIGDCRRCRLAGGRTKIVFGEGAPAARLVFAGEGPGRDEDSSGRPFVGRAGKLLDRIIAAMGFAREQVYICNVVKCRPPDNRTPQDDEMRTCGQFLSRQLEIIRPRFIVALGATAARYLTGANQSMGKMRGRFFGHPSGAQVLPTYHPAYLLRNPAAKKLVWEDVQKVMARMGKSPGAELEGS